MNPYHRLFDRQDDVAEHATELSLGMAIPYRDEPPAEGMVCDHRARQLVDEARRARVPGEGL